MFQRSSASGLCAPGLGALALDVLDLSVPGLIVTVLGVPGSGVLVKGVPIFPHYDGMSSEKRSSTGALHI